MYCILIHVTKPKHPPKLDLKTNKQTYINKSLTISLNFAKPAENIIPYTCVPKNYSE